MVQKRRGGEKMILQPAASYTRSIFYACRYQNIIHSKFKPTAIKYRGLLLFLLKGKKFSQLIHAYSIIPILVSSFKKLLFLVNR
jgi:hypothetical protein